MRECVGAFFVCNGSLTPVEEFQAPYLEKNTYVYEVFRVINGVALFLEDHFDRLMRSCLMSGVDFNLGFEEFAKSVSSLTSANSFWEGNIKTVVEERGKNATRILIFFTQHQYPTAEQFEKGVHLTLMKGIRVNPNAKVMDTALRNRANAVKQSQNVYETLLIDDDGFITEGSRSNVFFVRNDGVITPPISDVLPGVTRKYVLIVCEKLSIPVRQEKVAVCELIDMEGVFISGTSRKVLPVNSVDSKSFNVSHPVINKIKKGFHELVSLYIYTRLPK
jgi:branched-chain amino acid aminotransferase